MRPRRVLLLAALAPALMSPPAAGAAWNAGNGGAAFATARALAAPPAPTASVSGRNVSVQWSAPAAGPPAASYVVRRFDASSGAEAAIFSGCAGPQAGPSCTEAGVPPGDWRYAVAATRGAWRGPDSARSAPVSVAGPAVSLSPTTVTSLPATLSGGVTGFGPGQSLLARLDNAGSGMLLAGMMSPLTIPSSGAAVGSVVIPAGVTNGSHTVHVIGSDGDVASQEIEVITPTVAAAAIVKTADGDGGYVKRGGTYRVYANVTGSGSPPAGLGSVRADVGTITSGQTAATMTAGSYTAGGDSYNYRSAQLTAASNLAAGQKSFSVTATDAGGTAKLHAATVIADNTVPTASSLQAVNSSGGIARRAERGDTLTLTYSEPIDAQSVLAGWDGSSTNAVVRLVNGSNDSVQIWNASNTTQLRLGSVSLGRSDYTTSSVTFGASGVPSTVTRNGSNVTVVLGTPSATATTAGGTGTISWTPVSSATDRAGNAASTTARTTTGGAF